MEKQTEKTILAQNLIKLRKAYGLTQEQVANILKIKRSTYAYYERNIIPTPEIIQKLSKLFTISVHELLYGTPDPMESATPTLGDPNSLDEFDPDAFVRLSKKEKFIIYDLRMLPENLQQKVAKEIKELANKQD